MDESFLDVFRAPSQAFVGLIALAMGLLALWLTVRNLRKLSEIGWDNLQRIKRVTEALLQEVNEMKGGSPAAVASIDDLRVEIGQLRGAVAELARAVLKDEGEAKSFLGRFLEKKK